MNGIFPGMRARLRMKYSQGDNLQDQTIIAEGNASLRTLDHRFNLSLLSKNSVHGHRESLYLVFEGVLSSWGLE
jgi:hypothetical protein